MFHNAIIHFLLHALPSHTHTTPFQQFCQDLEQFQVELQIFQTPIFHILSLSLPENEQSSSNFVPVHD